MVEKGLSAKERLKECVAKALEKADFVRVDEDGVLYSEVRQPGGDVLSVKAIQDVLRGSVYKYSLGVSYEYGERPYEDTPRNCFYYAVEQLYDGALSDVRSAALWHVLQDGDVAALAEKYGADAVYIEKLIDDVWYPKLPFSELLSQEYDMVLLLDRGYPDNICFQNNFLGSNVQCPADFDACSPLLWLCEQQEVSREELFDAIQEARARAALAGSPSRHDVLLEDVPGNLKAEFVTSVIRECYRNRLTISNVVFLLKMTLDEACAFNEVLYREREAEGFQRGSNDGASFLVLDRGVRCGLMNTYNGQMAPFGLKFAKDVELSPRAIGYLAPADVLPIYHKDKKRFEKLRAEGNGFSRALKEIRQTRSDKNVVQEILADARARAGTHGESKNNVEMEK